MQIQFINQRNKFFQDVIVLGKKHSGNTGFYADGGFESYAEKGSIVFTSLNEQSSLYFLYSQVKTLNKPVTLL